MNDVLTTLTKLPPICATRLLSTGKPISIKRGVQGYWELADDFDVEGFNAHSGITDAQVTAMEIGSMFGWDAPGADPDNKA